MECATLMHSVAMCTGVRITAPFQISHREQAGFCWLDPTSVSQGPAAVYIQRLGYTLGRSPEAGTSAGLTLVAFALRMPGMRSWSATLPRSRSGQYSKRAADGSGGQPFGTCNGWIGARRRAEDWCVGKGRMARKEMLEKAGPSNALSLQCPVLIKHNYDLVHFQ
jgi:hypothetical protein